MRDVYKRQPKGWCRMRWRTSIICHSSFKESSIRCRNIYRNKQRKTDVYKRQGDEEVAILAGEHLAALGAPLVERPHEGFLVACVLVRRLEHRRGSRLVVYGNESVAGILERPARAGLTVDHTVINTNERD